MPRYKRYIPRRDDDFYNWQGNFVNILVARHLEWGIPVQPVNALVESRAEYEPLYHKAQNKTTRTSVDVLAHRKMRVSYEKELRAFVRKYCPLITDADRMNLGLTVHDLEPSPSKPITDVPIVGLKSLGGGDVEVRVRRTTDQTRASMHPDASDIEYRYILVAVGTAPPAKVADYPMHDFLTIAKFVLRVGDENIGKRLWMVVRWLNNRRPRQEGPWSGPISVIVG